MRRPRCGLGSARLFSFYNELLERRGRLVAAATAAPGALPFALADLASRFGAAAVHRLAPLEEAEQAEALARRARHRGLELPEETLTFLTRRAPRDFAALCRLLDELDLESLAAQRRLTVPFVRERWRSGAESPRGAARSAASTRRRLRGPASVIATLSAQRDHQHLRHASASRAERQRRPRIACEVFRASSPGRQQHGRNPIAVRRPADRCADGHRELTGSREPRAGCNPARGAPRAALNRAWPPVACAIPATRAPSACASLRRHRRARACYRAHHATRAVGRAAPVVVDIASSVKDRPTISMPWCMSRQQHRRARRFLAAMRRTAGSEGSGPLAVERA